MTLPSDRIGDKGQRFEVRAVKWPSTGESIVGWTNDAERAAEMTKAARRTPNCSRAWIIDREATSNTEDAA